MAVEEKAREHALNALSEEISKIEQAYIDGYKEAQSELGKTLIDEDGVKYIDLDLPSGTCWSQELFDGQSLVSLPYCEAEMYNLPTREQLKEMTSCCKRESNGTSIYYVGRNGKTLIVSQRLFWLRNESVTNDYWYKHFDEWGVVDNSFRGDRLFIILVKNRKDLK